MEHSKILPQQLEIEMVFLRKWQLARQLESVVK